MRFFSKAKDGGPESPVDAYFLFEIKSLASIAILKFNKGARESFHTHAFSALTWFISGDMTEERIDGTATKYSRSIFPKITKKLNNHRVIAHKTSWCFTIRGPWEKTWTEYRDGVTTTLTHGRVIYNIEDTNDKFMDIESLDPDERSWYYDGDGTKRKKNVIT